MSISKLAFNLHLTDCRAQILITFAYALKLPPQNVTAMGPSCTSVNGLQHVYLSCHGFMSSPLNKLQVTCVKYVKNPLLLLSFIKLWITLVYHVTFFNRWCISLKFKWFLRTLQLFKIKSYLMAPHLSFYQIIVSD